MGSTTKMTNNIIFYDGYCVVCSRFIRFLIKIDRKKLYSFANISSKIEGNNSCEWVLIDSGDVLLNIFKHEVRVFYDLERLWS